MNSKQQAPREPVTLQQVLKPPPIKNCNAERKTKCLEAETLDYDQYSLCPEVKEKELNSFQRFVHHEICAAQALNGNYEIQSNRTQLVELCVLSSISNRDQKLDSTKSMTFELFNAGLLPYVQLKESSKAQSNKIELNNTHCPLELFNAGLLTYVPLKGSIDLNTITEDVQAEQIDEEEIKQDEPVHPHRTTRPTQHNRTNNNFANGSNGHLVRIRSKSADIPNMKDQIKGTKSRKNFFYFPSGVSRGIFTANPRKVQQ